MCTCEEDQNYQRETHQSSPDRSANAQSPRPLKEAFSSDSHVHTRIRFHRPFRPSRRIPTTTVRFANPRYFHRKKSLSIHSFVNGALNTCGKASTPPAHGQRAHSSDTPSFAKSRPALPALSISHHTCIKLWTRARPNYNTPRLPATDDAAQSF